MKKLFSIIILAVVLHLAAGAQKVEVKYFHGKQRCATCLCIEKYAKELLNEQYQGKVKWVEVDLSTPEGKKEAEKYRVTWSSLIVVKGKEANDLTQMAFQYARKQPEEFKRLLKKEIDQMLKSK